MESPQVSVPSQPNPHEAPKPRRIAESLVRLAAPQHHTAVGLALGHADEHVWILLGGSFHESFLWVTTLVIWLVV